ncbi:hypothetical protein [Flavobacterium sp.]|jgi:hypothetical protein|uniref:hypothetical protein n=1 Tax=Flavobacterium sp. TaxID=239 RepID=UPI003BA867AB
MKQQNLVILILVLFLSSCGMKTKEGLTENYDENKNGIIELKNFYNKTVPKDFIVRIRYNSSDNIDLFVYQPTENSEKHELLFQQWNLDINDYVPENPRSDYDKKYHGITNSFEKVKEKLNWTNETFAKIYDKLDDVNCMGITNGNPTEIEYGFKGMGMFSYLIFDENLNSELQEKHSDDCTQMFYKENVVLSYGSGAIGSLCTPEFKRNE